MVDIATANFYSLITFEYDLVRLKLITLKSTASVLYGQSFSYAQRFSYSQRFSYTQRFSCA